MKKMKFVSLMGLFSAFFALAACSGGSTNGAETETGDNGSQPKAAGKTLVVYFSQQLPQGVDATTGATNVITENGNSYGAAQYLALMVARKTDADTLRLTVASGHYPLVYNDLAEFARAERDRNSHPALTSRQVNMADYANVVLVTPIWWYTVPMPIYSFLDAYDLGGKNVYVAATHAGSNMADAIAVVRREEPAARVSARGLAVAANQVSAATSSAVDRWLGEIGY